MKKTFFTHLFLWCIVVCFAFTTFAQNRSSQPSLTAESNKTSTQIDREGVGALLWDNFLIEAASGIVSCEWGGLPVGANQTLCADDFVVPPGESWTIDEIAATGFYTAGEADVWGVQFFADAGGAPGVLLATVTVPLTVGVTDPAGLLSTPVVLGSGTFWIAIYSIFNTSADIGTHRWNWLATDDGLLSEPYLTDNAGWFGGLPWTSFTDLGIGQFNGHMFQLYGTSTPQGCTLGAATGPTPLDGAVDLPATGNTISWTNGAGADSICVYFGEVGAFPQLIYDGVPISTLPLTAWEPLDCNTTYGWQILGKSDTCEVWGPYWTFSTVSIVATNPSPADGATDLPISGNTVTWTNHPNTTTTEVWFGEPGALLQIYSGPAITSLSLAGEEPLAFLTTYDWTVVSTDAFCDQSVTWTFTTEQNPLFVCVFEDHFPADISMWTAIGPDNPGNWRWWTGNNAGIAAGEMNFTWSPNFVGSSFILSDVIPSAGFDLTVEFNHFLDWFGGAGAVGFGYTTDGGATWTTLYEAVDPTANIGPETQTFTGVPGDANFQLIAWFSGDSFNLNDWFIDDVLACYIIPVELTSFSASVNEMDVTLNWITATEINNMGFEVQRSSNGSDYTRVAFVEGHGTIAETQNYTYSDKNLNVGAYTYRLKQIDFDGTSELSDLVEVEIIAPAVFALEQNYPNPFNPSTKIKFSLAADSRVSLTVFDVLGQKVMTLVNGNLSAGSHNISFNASNLNSGVYFYRIDAVGVDGANFTSVKKMILTK